jgi:hypothetical protein
LAVCRHVGARILFAALIGGAVLATPALTQSFDWAVSAGGTSEDVGRGIATGAAGNSYVTGSFYGPATFGSTELTSIGSRDVFVAKVDSAGQVLWAASAGGQGFDNAYGIATDLTGNSHMTGRFAGTASFGSTVPELVSTGSYDAFWAKLNDPPYNSRDFDADGLSDILWQNAATGQRYVWFMNGLTRKGSAVNIATVLTDWSMAGTGDFDADGKPDILWQNTVNGARLAWLMNGTTRKGGAITFANIDPLWSIVR